MHLFLRSESFLLFVCFKFFFTICFCTIYLSQSGVSLGCE